MVIILRAVILCISLNYAVHSLTWDFSQDNSQGWLARESVASGRETTGLPLPDSIEEGIWRIRPVQFSEVIASPSVELISPHIGYDSALFDIIRLRVRIQHHQPLRGTFMVRWITPSYPDLGGESAGRFLVGQPMVFTTEWQEIALADLPYLEGKSWEGELIKFHLHLLFAEQKPYGPDDAPDWVEVDWIQLTGMGEQLLADPLPLPGSETLLPRRAGVLFEAPIFLPIRSGIDEVFPVLSGVHRPSALVDMDQDGYLDFVGLWHESGRSAGGDLSSRSGWVVAINDGSGLFTPKLERDGLSNVFGLWPLNLEGRGAQAVVMSVGRGVQVWHADDELNLALLLEQKERLLLGVADLDEDGKEELLLRAPPWSWEADFRHYSIEVWSYQHGSLSPHYLLNMGDRYNRHFPYKADYFSAATEGAILLAPLSASGKEGLLLVQELLQDEFQVTHLNAAIPLHVLLFAGDISGDGQMELISAQREVLDPGRYYRGLNLWLPAAEGEWRSHVWYDQRVWLRDRIQAWDLDGDGVLDPVFVNSNPSQGFGLVVHLGGREGVPEQEGWYPLTGLGGQILAGDLDNDGDLDLVVADRSLGGVHVLKNRLSEGFGTAVLEPVAALRPPGFHLGANYPNPFNPRTTIPFTLEREGWVRLRVYDLLGRPVRTLWDGLLPAGAQRLEWDGRNAAGQAVASGVYFYRLEAGGQVHSRKLLKLE